MKTPTVRNESDRRPCSAGFPTCESTSRTRGLSGQSTFPSPELRTLRQPILHSAIRALHSRNPHCTSVFFTVPPNPIFSFGSRIEPQFHFGASLAFGIWARGHFSCGRARSATARSIFPPQVPGLTFLTLCFDHSNRESGFNILPSRFFEPLRTGRASADSDSDFNSILFHRKKPAIPPIPLNSTSVVSPNPA